MAAPWEKYSQPEPVQQAAGPWAKYSAPEASNEVPVTDLPSVRAVIAPEDLPWQPTKVQRADYMLTRAREVYPQLANVDDRQLLTAIRQDMFPDVPIDQFYREAGMSPADIAEADPTEGMSGGQLFRAGLGSSFAATGQGLKQLALSAARNLTQTGYEETDASRAIGRAEQAAMGQEAERRRLTAPLMDTGAGFAGNVTGNVAQIVGPGVTLKGAAMVPQLSRLAPALEAGGGAILPTTVRGSAASGAGFGAAQPRVEGESVGQNMAAGAGAGALGAGLPRVAQAVGQRAARLSPAFTASQQERAAGEVLEQFASDPDAVRRSLATSQVIVPGTRPTLAEATEDAGLAGLQKFLGNRPELQPLLREAVESNNAARVKAIEDAFGGADVGTIERLTDARDLAARQILRPITGITLKDVTPVNNAVDRLITKNASAKNVREALGAVKEELGTIKTVQDAHNVRQYIDQLISGQVEGKAGAKFAQKELMTVKDILDRQMRQAYPEWGKFLRDYKAASREIGQVSMGRTLLDKGPNISGVGDIPVLSPDKFAGAASDLDRVARQATGFKRARADNIVTPDQSRVVDEVRRDLERFARSNSRAAPVSGGSATMQNAVGGTRVQDALGPVGATMIEPVSGAALLFLNAARKNYGEKVAVIVNEAILNPDRAAEVLARLPPKSRRAITRQIAPLLNQAGSVSGRATPAAVQE